MFKAIIKKILGNKNQRLIKGLYKIVEQVNVLEDEYKQLTDTQLIQQKDTFKQRLASGESLNDILPQAFAAVREASVRTLGLRHFDVQLIGGICLHNGKVAQMRTGEGKTLVATLAAYLNSLSGNSVHIITVNDYLAERDAAWMTPLYNALGMSVGTVLSTQEQTEKKPAYAADVVYGTNNEFGFDYLRDNMAMRKEDIVQGSLAFAIVDEVDSILIDEARTPLIISGAQQNVSKLYQHLNQIIPKILKADTDNSFLKIDEAHNSLELTDAGHEYVEQILIKEKLIEAHSNLYAPENLSLLHYVQSSLRAHKLFKRNDHYLVKNDQIIIIDEHTGRALPGRRWSDGLHQAVEAKEKVAIQNENQTLASTSFQNYFLLYDKLSGMTGTADTEAHEFKEIYKLDVAVIPTNKPSRRDDLNDLIYATQTEKYQAIAEEIKKQIAKQRPILVGTTSIESSEYMSKLLTKHQIKHNVLNAKHHHKEAEIIAEAGVPSTVTVATNMAGRGTDIVLGGNLELELVNCKSQEPAQLEQIKKNWQDNHKIVTDAGGLYVICSERHESRRIDNQLRGRTGRQGDPGTTRFFLSLEDDLMRIFVSEQVQKIMNFIGLEEGMAIEHPMVNRAIAKAQQKVEARNFQARKQLLEYDDIANEQRAVIYRNRHDLLVSETIDEQVTNLLSEAVTNLCSKYIPANSYPDQWQLDKVDSLLTAQFNHDFKIEQWLDKDENSSISSSQIYSHVLTIVEEEYAKKCTLLDENILNDIQRQLMIQVIDNLWKNQLTHMDQLRQGIHLRSYAQRSPKQEYKREAFVLFENMWQSIGSEFSKIFFHLNFVNIADDIQQQKEAHAQSAAEQQQQELHYQHNEQPDIIPADKPHVKLGRNDKCFCGSNKKFKHCHG
jgi:preprotein translocase subunit SecA